MITLELDASETKAVQAFRQVAGALKEIGDKSAALVEQGKTAREVWSEFGKTATKAFEGSLNPLEKLGQALKGIDGLVARGQANEQTALALKEKAHDKYLGQVEAGARRQAAIGKRLADEEKQESEKTVRLREMTRQAQEAAAKRNAAVQQQFDEQEAQRARQLQALKRQLAGEEEQIKRAGIATWEATRTAEERYKQSLDGLATQYAKGAIDVGTYNRAVAKTDEEYAKAKSSGQATFGQAMLGKLTSMAAGVLSIGAAWRLVTQYLSDYQEKAREAGERGKQAEGGMAELAQLTTDPVKYHEYTERAKEIFARGGARTLEDAAKLEFQLVSGGAEKEWETFSALGETALVKDPALMAMSARTLQANLGEKQTGSLRSIVSKAFAGSQYAPTSAEDLLAAASRGAQGAKALGLRDEELLAATGITATTSGAFSRQEKAAVGGTQVASLLKSLQKISAGKTGGGDEFSEQSIDEVIAGKGGKGVKGIQFHDRSLLGMVQSIDALHLDNAQLIKLFGRQEALQAYRSILANQEQYSTARGGIQRAGREDLVGRHLAMAMTEPSVAAAGEARRAKAAHESEQEAKQIWNNYADAAEADLSLGLAERGTPSFVRWMVKRGAGAERWLRGDRAFTNRTRQNFGSLEFNASVDSYEAEQATGHHYIPHYLLPGAAGGQKAVGGSQPAGQFPMNHAAEKILLAADTLRVAAHNMAKYQPPATMVDSRVDR